jgi:hypothetical protein
MRSAWLLYDRTDAAAGELATNQQFWHGNNAYCALTIAHIKKEKPAVGTTNDLTVKRWRILWTGNQIAGKEQSQKMKKDTKALVLVPELGMPLWTLVNEGQIASIIRVTHSPPIHACTPYQIQAIAARLKTGHSAPQMPKDARETTGNEMW